MLPVNPWFDPLGVNTAESPQRRPVISLRMLKGPYLRIGATVGPIAPLPYRRKFHQPMSVTNRSGLVRGYRRNGQPVTRLPSGVNPMPPPATRQELGLGPGATQDPHPESTVGLRAGRS